MTTMWLPNSLFLRGMLFGDEKEFPGQTQSQVVRGWTALLLAKQRTLRVRDFSIEWVDLGKVSSNVQGLSKVGSDSGKNTLSCDAYI